jgi:hypothetical protein
MLNVTNIYIVMKLNYTEKDEIYRLQTLIFESMKSDSLCANGGVLIRNGVFLLIKMLQ